MVRDKAAKPVVRKVKTSLALPDHLWRLARIRAIEQGIDAQDLVARALDEYLQKKGKR